MYIVTKAVQRLNNIRGKQTTCIVTVTHGNRNYDDALMELADLVKANGLVVQASSSFNWTAYIWRNSGRPNASDDKENQQFVKAFFEVLKKEAHKGCVELSIKGKRPYMEVGMDQIFVRIQKILVPNVDRVCEIVLRVL